MFWQKRQRPDELSIPDNVAISIRNLNKTFKTSLLKPKAVVTAISDLSLDIPKSGIFVLLGSNGCVPSVLFSVLACSKGPIAPENRHHCPS